ncbi:hypothetical protein [Microvirga alba]|uniref:Uncharacterized protein n=1 Tax=Microvirga alba TaxID=2791025 RepID=A0A931BRF5_9HYPH|nr:hypothetical protein [Microvirga alba]MBF9235556.1 hypothetical protein [Microvirga alba]
MNCCDEFGNCRQGRDCPARIERVRIGMAHLDAEMRRDRMRPLVKWLVIYAVVMIATWFTLNAALAQVVA